MAAYIAVSQRVEVISQLKKKRKQTNKTIKRKIEKLLLKIHINIL